MSDTTSLLEQFAAMSHEDKYAKVLIYLDVMRQKTSEFIWLYGLVSSLWLSLNEDTLTDIYTSVIDMVSYGKSHKLAAITRGLEQKHKMHTSHQQMEKQDKVDADELLQDI